MPKFLGRTTTRLSKGQTLAGRKGLAPGPENSRGWAADAADHALVAGARHGDSDAFEALYVRHRDVIAALCRRWLRDEQLAEDATQETFLRAWAALPHYSSTGDFRSWLRRIARNQCHDLWRSRYGRTITEVPTDVRAIDLDTPQVDGESPERVPDRLAVRAMLGGLSSRDAAMLVEHHAAGLPVSALARRWQLTHGAAEVAVHRARRRARRVAERMDLRGLIPVDGLRRLLGWTERFFSDVGGASSGAVVLCQLAVVAAAVAGSALGWNDQKAPPAVTAPADVTQVAGDGTSRSAGTTHADSARRPDVDAHGQVGDAHGQVGDKRRKDAPPKNPKRLATIDPIPVPVAGGSLRSSADPRWQERHRYGVRNPTTGGNLVGKTTHEHDQDRDLHDHGCAVADATESTTLTYCE